jgi:hypothetical protein
MFLQPQLCEIPAAEQTLETCFSSQEGTETKQSTGMGGTSSRDSRSWQVDCYNRNPSIYSETRPDGSAVTVGIH